MTEPRSPPRPGFVPPSQMAEVIQELRNFRASVEARLDHLESVSPPPMRPKLASQRDLDRLAGTVERVFEQVEEIATGRHHIPPPGFIPTAPAMPSERVRELVGEEEARRTLAQLQRKEAQYDALKQKIVSGVVVALVVAAAMFTVGRITAPPPVPPPPPPAESR
jgi:hypothetical protein